MSDTNNPGDKTLAKGPSKPLSLKRPIEQGTVRQSFSHGRSKQVVVETVKRRVIGATPGTTPPREAAPAAARPAPAAPAAPARPAPTQRSSSGVVLRTLSEQEQGARAAALADAQRREQDARRHAEDEARQRRERELAEQREREAAETRKREEEARRRQEDEHRRHAAEEARRRAEARLAENLNGEESATVHAALAHSLAQLNVKRRQR